MTKCSHMGLCETMRHQDRPKPFTCSCDVPPTPLSQHGVSPSSKSCSLFVMSKHGVSSSSKPPHLIEISWGAVLEALPGPSGRPSSGQIGKKRVMFMNIIVVNVPAWVFLLQTLLGICFPLLQTLLGIGFTLLTCSKPASRPDRAGRQGRLQGRQARQGPSYRQAGQAGKAGNSEVQVPGARVPESWSPGHKPSNT